MKKLIARRRARRAALPPPAPPRPPRPRQGRRADLRRRRRLRLPHRLRQGPRLLVQARPAAARPSTTPARSRSSASTSASPPAPRSPGSCSPRRDAWHKHALAGTYVGASTEATLGVGLGANWLIGGSHKSFALQPCQRPGPGRPQLLAHLDRPHPQLRSVASEFRTPVHWAGVFVWRRRRSRLSRRHGGGGPRSVVEGAVAAGRGLPASASHPLEKRLRLVPLASRPQIVVVGARHDPDPGLVRREVIDPLPVMYADRLVRRAMRHEHRLLDLRDPLVDRILVAASADRPADTG